MCWWGYFKIHQPYGWYTPPHENTVVQGSKAIAFQRRGLIQLREFLFGARPQHFDLDLSKQMRPGVIHKPARSFFGCRGRLSVPDGSGAPPRAQGRVAPGSKHPGPSGTQRNSTRHAMRSEAGYRHCSVVEVSHLLHEHIGILLRLLPCLDLGLLLSRKLLRLP